MEEIIEKIAEIVVIGMYHDCNFLSERTLSWGLIVFLMRLSIILMNTQPSDNNSDLKSKVCFALFCLYLFSGLLFSFTIYYFYSFILIFIITSALSILRYSPPFLFEKKGSGGLFRMALEGFFWVLLQSLALSDSPKFLIFNFLPVFLVYEAWYLTKELHEAAEDIKNKVMTTGILIGKYGWYKIFYLLHFCSFVFGLMDLWESRERGAPLMLVPWAVYQVKELKKMSSYTMQTHAFLYFICYVMVTCIGIFTSRQ